MTLDGKKVIAVDGYRALSWSATFAIKEALNAKWITTEQADHMIDRMNEIMDDLIDGKIVTLNKATGLFEGRDRDDATEGEVEPSSDDVLVIKGGQ